MKPKEAARELEQALEREHPNYEPRPEQRRMAMDVAECLESGGVLLAEAPTGLGKTLAYLLPALEWARAAEQPVVVATHTKHLQDQILESELPIAARALGGEVRAVRLKGRENYLCRARVEGFLAEGAGTAAARRIQEVLQLAHDGDLSAAELSEDAWSALRGTELHAGHCPAQICHATRGCWLRQARRRAQEAHLVVVNHALWLSDRRAGGTILPEFSRIIVDEAHHLPEAFTQALAVRFSEHGFRGALERLVGKPRSAGLLKAVRKDQKGKKASSGGPDPESIDALAAALERVRLVSGAAFEAMGRKLAGRGRQRLDHAADPAELFPPQLDVLLDHLRDSFRAASRLNGVEEAEDDAPPGSQRLWPYVARALGQWQQAGQALLDLTGPIAPEYCATAEVHRAHGVVMECVPWNIAKAGSEELTRRMESVVLTSATLSVDGRFDYLCERLGLRQDEVTTQVYRSTLDPAAQLLALSVRSVGDPRDVAFVPQAAEVVAELAGLGRNMLVLATSWESLKGLESRLQGRVPSLLVQADPRGRSGLSRQLRQSRGAVLLGVQSFWEGVDLPGEALEILVMLKLPFGVPTDPVFEARRQDFESRGLDPFRGLAVPEAVLRFRQGLGRLLRRTTDRGVFVLLDRRALGSGYGKSFAQAIGTPLRQVEGPAEAARAAREFWNGRPS